MLHDDTSLCGISSLYGKQGKIYWHKYEKKKSKYGYQTNNRGHNDLITNVHMPAM